LIFGINRRDLIHTDGRKASTLQMDCPCAKQLEEIEKFCSRFGGTLALKNQMLNTYYASHNN